MRKLLFFILIFSFTRSFSQQDSTKWLWAFPITDYIVNADDSMKIVQVHLPGGYPLREKQPGLIRGIYNNSIADTVQKGYGRCYLVKGGYYYFTIGHNTSGVPLKEGDLLYTFIDRSAIYFGQVPQLASHFIELQNVYGQPFYDRESIFYQWAETDEKTLVDSIVKDIRFTGAYFMKQNASMDQLITRGPYKGRKIFSVMTACQPVYVRDFIDYYDCPSPSLRRREMESI